MECSKCGGKLEAYKTVVLNDEEKSEEVCMDCFNEEIEDVLGIETGNLIVKQITMPDKEGKTYLFDITKMIVPTGIALEAREIKTQDEEGYEFHVLGDIDCDINKLFKELYQKVEKRINIKSIDNNGTIKETVEGRITWDKDADDRMPMLVIDGKEISWNEFGSLLMTYEGFQFKLNLIDITD